MSATRRLPCALFGLPSGCSKRGRMSWWKRPRAWLWNFRPNTNARRSTRDNRLRLCTSLHYGRVYLNVRKGLDLRAFWANDLRALKLTTLAGAVRIGWERTLVARIPTFSAKFLPSFRYS
jgi:hypothetical protein